MMLMMVLMMMMMVMTSRHIRDAGTKLGDRARLAWACSLMWGGLDWVGVDSIIITSPTHHISRKIKCMFFFIACLASIQTCGKKLQPRTHLGFNRAAHRAVSQLQP